MHDYFVFQSVFHDFFLFISSSLLFSSLLLSLLLSCLSSYMSLFIFLFLLSFSLLLLLFSCSSLFRLLFSLSVFFSVCWWCVVVSSCVCVWCGVVCRVVWHAENPVCRLKNALRVYIQNVPVYAGNTRTCFSACARGASTHGDVLNLRSEAFLSLHTGGGRQFCLQKFAHVGLSLDPRSPPKKPLDLTRFQLENRSRTLCSRFLQSIRKT